ncbi:9508_t:CDS:2, partial [Funneliformis geosporum]
PIKETKSFYSSISEIKVIDQIFKGIYSFAEFVHEDKRSFFMTILESEKQNVESLINTQLTLKDIELIQKDKELIQKDKVLDIMAINTGRIYMEYLKMKGIYHLRGVLELWETVHMDHILGNRENKWMDFFENKEELKIFQNF